MYIWGPGMQRSKSVSLILLALVFCLTKCLHAQAPAAPPFTLKQVAPNVWAAIADFNGSAGGNGGFVIGDDSVLVIDTFTTFDAAQQLLAEIHKLTALPIKFVINTHYHLDHVGGNRVLADAGATVLAQRNVGRWIISENLRLIGQNAPPELKAITDGIAAPTVLYEQGVDLYLGSRKIQVRSFPGHTGGDSVVLVPDANVVFCGDLFWSHSLPNLVDATTRSWIETLDILIKTQPKSTFVSGHADVGNVDDVAAFREYLQNLRALVAEGQKQGKPDDALIETVLPVLSEKYRDWNFFTYVAKPNILDVSAELEGTKRIPPVDMPK